MNPIGETTKGPQGLNFPGHFSSQGRATHPGLAAARSIPSGPADERLAGILPGNRFRGRIGALNEVVVP
jgi:hypothetical protein